MNWPDFLHADANSGKPSYFNNFWVGLVKHMCCSLGYETLKSTLSQGWIDELRWFLAYRW